MLKTHTLYAFLPTFCIKTIENGDVYRYKKEVFEEALQSEDFEKEVYRFGVDGDNRAFRKHCRHNYLCESSFLKHGGSRW